MSDLRVMLVEDNEDTGTALSMLLDYAGYRVRWARSAEEACAAMREAVGRGEPPHVLVMDIMLPDASGPLLVESLSRFSHVPPVIVHSAAAEWVLAEAAMRVGAAATLRKPVEGRRLIEAIEAVAHHPVTNGTRIA